ncbi:MAG: hypothetical protein K6G78_00700 [bacterium]|nr:hypothetical protein [bacterium]
MDEKTICDRLIELERDHFSHNWFRGRDGDPCIMEIPGEVPIMVSAPHAVTHVRDGATYPSEDCTGPLALVLQELTGCHAMVQARFDGRDPNWDALEDSPYKQRLLAVVRERGIKLVLDIHGMVGLGKPAVEIGTNDGATCLAMPEVERLVYEQLSEDLAEFSERYGAPVVLNGMRAARRANTVAQTVVRECSDVAAVQIELSTRFRVPSRVATYIPQGEQLKTFGDAEKASEGEVRRDLNPAAVAATVRALAQIIEKAAEL